MARVAVIGCGRLGRLVVGELARCGCFVAACDVTQDALDELWWNLQQNFYYFENQGLLSQEQANECLDRVSLHLDARGPASESEIVIEVSSADTQRAILSCLSAVIRSDAILVSCSLDHAPNVLAKYCGSSRHQLVAARFLAPVYFIEEVVISPNQSLESSRKFEKFINGLGKHRASVPKPESYFLDLEAVIAQQRRLTGRTLAAVLGVPQVAPLRDNTPASHHSHSEAELPPFSGSIPEAVCQKLEIDDSLVYSVDSFFSADECQYYVNRTEALGFQSLEKEFLPEHRNSERCTVCSAKIAEVLWERVRPHLRLHDVVNLRPYGFGTDGDWEPVGVTQWLKFSRYHPETYFKAHLDSPYVRSDDQRSILTLMVYLNDGFEGGDTLFFPFGPCGETATHSVTPKTGRALIFTHDTRHEGSKVSLGIKYILRTEILFRRTGPSRDDGSWRHCPAHLKSSAAFTVSARAEAAGNVDLSAKNFTLALELQATRRSLVRSQPRRLTGPAVFLSADTARNIFGFLEIAELLPMGLVCFAWLSCARDPQIWRIHFKQRWEKCFDITAEAGTGDWYTDYQNRRIAETEFKTAVFDLGEHSVKYAIVGQPLPKPIPSVVGTEARFHCAVPGKAEYDATRIGVEARSSYTLLAIQEPIKNGAFTDPEGLLALFWWAFAVGFGHGDTPPQIGGTLSGSYLRALDKTKSFIPPAHPVLVAEPVSGVLSDADRSMVQQIVFGKLKVPMLAFADGAVLALMAHGLTSGVVVHLGLRSSVVAIVKESQCTARKLIPNALPRLANWDWRFETHAVGEIDVPQIAQVLAATIESENDSKLWDAVVCTGGRVTPSVIEQLGSAICSNYGGFVFHATGDAASVLNGGLNYVGLASARSCFKPREAWREGGGKSKWDTCAVQ